MGQFAALLRGVNVGPTTRVPMAELRELLESHGARCVKTHLNSGNAVFDLEASPKSIDAELGGLISERFGFAVDVTCRSKKQLGAALTLDPLGRLGEDDSKYVIAFMPELPGADAIREVLGGASSGVGTYAAGEECAANGREFYVWTPAGVSKSQALKAFAKAKPAPFATVRNVRTVQALIDLIPPRSGSPAG